MHTPGKQRSAGERIGLGICSSISLEVICMAEVTRRLNIAGSKYLMIPALTHDVLVLGGGPAGSTLAINLVKAGRQVVLIEKNREPEHKVCGEFLSPECSRYLQQVDIQPERLGAQIIHSVRIAARDVIAEASLPVPGLSLTRRTLDEALLQSARQAGVYLLRGYTVDQLERAFKDDGSITWKTQITDPSKASTTILGQDAFLATGKHDLRGWRRSTRGTHATLVALKMYFILSPEQQKKINSHVELILYPGGYAGLQPVEDGYVNLCALITKERLRSLGGGWHDLLDHMVDYSPHLEKRLAGARPVLDHPLAVSSIPYGYRAGAIEEGAESPWKLGDQAAVIPSFCGDGMAIAFYTADRASQFYLGGSTSAAFHADVRRQLERRLYWTSMLSRFLVAMPSLAQALRLHPSALQEIFTATRLPLSARISTTASREY